MIVYLDTSALVATHVAHAVSAKATAALARATEVATSAVTYAEAFAALAALARAKLISARARARVESELIRDWASFQRVRVDARLDPDIRRLLRSYPLKGADAIHLATASLVARAAMARGLACEFASDDRTLARAAKAEGLTLAW